MDAWGLAHAADEVATLISADTARELLFALEGLTAGAEVRRALRMHSPAEVLPILSPLILECGVERTCSAIAASVATASRLEAEADTVGIVWTGPPTVPVPNHRPTAAVISELIASAKEHITLATYSAGNVDEYIDLLDVRRRQGVDVRLLLETVRSDGSGPDCPKVFERLLPFVNALEWPRGSRHHYDYTHMHVKILIRDVDAVLVTSANFSEAAMRHNMELGVELRGGQTARRLRQHFDDLEAIGAIERLPVGVQA